MVRPPYKSREALLIEKNLINAFVAMSNNQLFQDKTQYLFSNIPIPIFNCVIDVNLDPKNTEQNVKAIWAEYEENNKPHCWWISERSEPQQIVKILTKFNFVKGPFYRGVHALIKDVKRNFEDDPRIRIEKVNDIKTLEEWVKPLQLSFNFSDEVTFAFLQRLKKLYQEDERLIHFVAFYDNQLAGAASLFLDDDSAGFYNGSTFPVFRKKGVMTRLRKARLMEAEARGYKDVIIQVTEDTFNTVAQAGFKIYFNLQSYFSPSLP